MPRKSAGIRLYLRKERRDKSGRITHAATWVIRETGRPDIATGCGAGERAKADQRLAEHIGTRYQPERKERRLSQISIADVIAIYAEDVAPGLANPRKAGQECKRLIEYFGALTLDELNGRRCRAYVAARGTSGGARRDLQTLSAAVQHHHREGYHAEAVRVWLPPKGPPRERWLTRQEIAKLVWAAWRTEWVPFTGYRTFGEPKRTSRHIARAILLAYYTGSRIGDVLSASWYAAAGRSFIDMEQGVFYRLPIGKKQTNKRRPSIRLGSRIMAHLKRWQKTGGQYVVEYNGQRVGEINKGFQTACHDAGLSGVSPHTLRHSRATHLMQSDVPDWEIAGYLGMSIDVLRKTYAHHSPSAQKRAAEAR